MTLYEALVCVSPPPYMCRQWQQCTVLAASLARRKGNRAISAAHGRHTTSTTKTATCTTKTQPNRRTEAYSTKAATPRSVARIITIACPQGGRAMQARGIETTAGSLHISCVKLGWQRQRQREGAAPSSCAHVVWVACLAPPPSSHSGP